MNNSNSTHIRTKPSKTKRVLAAMGFVVALLVGFSLVAQHFSDGPIGPIQGGALRTGTLITEPDQDWSTLLAGEQMASVELQLVNPLASRITGAFAYEGGLYIPCDLGFIWRRLPDTTSRRMMHLIWLVKGWHEHAQADGRVLMRYKGLRYPLQAVRVTDPAVLADLRTTVEDAALSVFGSLLPEPADPGAIWFFRLDPREAGET